MDHRASGRRIGTIAGGTFGGDCLRGVILSGRSDWQTERGDGAILLDARIVLRTGDEAVLRAGDEALIATTYAGIRHGPADVMASLAEGATVDPASYYSGSRPRSSRQDRRYDWLNRTMAVGTGSRLANGPTYSIHGIA